MNIASPTESGKPAEEARPDQASVALPLALARDLEAYVRQAARDGKPLHHVERHIFDTVLRIGFASVEQFLALQGHGDLGPTVTPPHGQTLQRSDQPVRRPLRTVFGLHTIQAYVYAPGPHRAIALRPIDARLQLPPGRCSYLFQEFSQYFCVEQAFGQSARGMDTVLHQKVPVDTLERLNRGVAEQAAEFLDQLPTPPADQEGELLVLTGDAKGVPLVRGDAQRLPIFDPSERPGNRRMAALACVYSVDRHVRTPQQIVAALFRDEPRPRSAARPEPQFKHLRARFARTYQGRNR